MSDDESETSDESNTGSSSEGFESSGAESFKGTFNDSKESDSTEFEDSS